MQQRYTPCNVIEHQQRLRRDECGIRHAGLLDRIDGQLLEQPHNVIAGHTNKSTRKRQIVSWLRLRCRREGRAQRVEVFLLVGGARLLVTVDTQPLAVHAHFERIAKAEERIAREPLTALNGFEQEARPQGLELQVSRYRRIQVGRDVEWCLHSHSQKKTHP
jgi:hypothetical protein